MEQTAVVDIGLTRAECWDLTPREYDGFFQRFLEREDRANRRAALIAVHIANYAGKMRSKLLSINDILQPRNGGHQQETEGDSFVNRLRAENPQTELTMAKAVLDGVAYGRYKVVTLGTREGLLESASVQAMIRGELK